MNLWLLMFCLEYPEKTKALIHAQESCLGERNIFFLLEQHTKYDTESRIYDELHRSMFNPKRKVLRLPQIRIVSIAWKLQDHKYRSPHLHWNWIRTWHSLFHQDRQVMRGTLHFRNSAFLFHRSRVQEDDIYEWCSPGVRWKEILASWETRASWISVLVKLAKQIFNDEWKIITRNVFWWIFIRFLNDGDQFYYWWTWSCFILWELQLVIRKRV